MKLAMGTSAGLALVALVVIGGCQKAATNASDNSATNTAAAAASNAPAVATNAPPVEATAEADAKAFLDGIYAHYKTSKNNNFQPFDGNAKEVLDADTITLLRTDNKLLKGEVGAVESDWICDCQDFESIAATVTIQSATATEAKATVEFRDTLMSGDSGKPRHDAFDLVKTPDGWRIHDMGTADQPSLRRALQDEIKTLKAGG